MTAERWGAGRYGDPCRECGFAWSVDPPAAIRSIADAPAAFDLATARADGRERGSGWSVAEYVSHVADNLRQWAERVQAARLAGRLDVAGYDPDALAVARGYTSIPLPVARWSLTLAASTWADVLGRALEEEVVVRHATRGAQRAEDIARNNAHDAHHHLWDVRQILAAPPR